MWLSSPFKIAIGRLAGTIVQFKATVVLACCLWLDSISVLKELQFGLKFYWHAKGGSGHIQTLTSQLLNVQYKMMGVL